MRVLACSTLGPAPGLNAGQRQRVAHSIGASRFARQSPVGLVRRARWEQHRLAAGKSPKDGPPEPPTANVGDDDDFFPGGDSVRAWQALEQETRSVIQLSAGFFLLPALLSWALRATVIDPLLYWLQVRCRPPSVAGVALHVLPLTTPHPHCVSPTTGTWT